MPPTRFKPPAAVVSDPNDWIELRDGNRTFYADPLMVRNADGDPITYFDFYNSSIFLQRSGLRNPTDREYNLMLKNPVIAKGMRSKIWTSFVKNVEKKGERFTGLYIERPEVRGNNYDDFQVVGSEKRIDLPATGWFKISELLQSETSFPERTYDSYYPPNFRSRRKQDELFAFFAIHEGDVDIIRGPVFIAICARYAEDWVYDITIGGKVRGTCGGIRAVSDEKPEIQTDALMVRAKEDAKNTALRMLDEQAKREAERYNKTLREIQEGRKEIERKYG